jgi:hypothetical protein
MKMARRMLYRKQRNAGTNRHLPIETTTRQSRTGRGNMTKSNAAVRVRTRSTQKINVGAEVSRAGVVTLAIAAGLVGAWVITAFVAGMIASGGLVPMISNWFTAVIG